MLCFPGFFPVAADVHAGGVSAGSVLRRSADAPSARRRAKVGSFPCSTHGLISWNVAPSRPTTTIRDLDISDTPPRSTSRSCGHRLVHRLETAHHRTRAVALLDTAP